MATNHSDSSAGILENPIDKLTDIGSNMLYVRVARNQHLADDFDTVKLVDQLDRDLIRKEQEAVDLLKQLKATRKIVQVLKADSSMVSGSLLPELIRNCNRASLALTLIRGPVESLNRNMRQWEFHERRMNSNTSSKPALLWDVEEQQLQRMKDATRYEFMKAMREMEITKNSIIMAEMRLNAAKRMEEAVKAVEAIAVAERRGFSSKSDDLLSWKSDARVVDKNVIERQTSDGDKTIHMHPTKLKHRNPPRHPPRRPAISIGAILSRKLTTQYDQKCSVHQSNGRGAVEKQQVPQKRNKTTGTVFRE